jgi:hypothetical protein
MLELAAPTLIAGWVPALAWPLGAYMRWAMDPASPGPRRLAYEGLCTWLLGRFAETEQR